MTHIGTVSKKGTFIQGSHQMDSWMDYWLEAHTINYDGELTEEVCKRIEKAYQDYLNKNWKFPLNAMLRTPQRPHVKHVDVEKRVLVVERSTMMCD